MWPAPTRVLSHAIAPVRASPMASAIIRAPATSAVSSAMVASTRRVMSSAANKGRPMSPHLTIYKPQLNSITSITFRATGVILTVGTVGGSVLLLGASKPVEHYIETIKRVPLLAPLFKFGIAFSLSYHYIGGLRHLAWDRVLFHTPEQALKSARGMVAASVGIGLIAAAVSFDNDEE